MGDGEEGEEKGKATGDAEPRFGFVSVVAQSLSQALRKVVDVEEGEEDEEAAMDTQATSNEISSMRETASETARRITRIEPGIEPGAADRYRPILSGSFMLHALGVKETCIL